MIYIHMSVDLFCSFKRFNIQQIIIGKTTLENTHITIVLYAYYHVVRRGCDRMVVGFTTTCAISAYQH